MTVAVAVERYAYCREVKIQDFSDIKSMELQFTSKLFLIATVGSKIFQAIINRLISLS